MYLQIKYPKQPHKVKVKNQTSLKIVLSHA